MFRDFTKIRGSFNEETTQNLARKTKLKRNFFNLFLTSFGITGVFITMVSNKRSNKRIYMKRMTFD